MVEILRRRIYLENIQFYENAYYRNETWKDKVIPENEYSFYKIKVAIIKNMDLNTFGSKNGQKCIFSDLNKYFWFLKQARIIPIEKYVEVLTSLEINSSLLQFMNEFFATHTEEENMEMKKIFLKKVGVSFTSNESSDHIEYLYMNAVENLDVDAIDYRKVY